MAASQGIFAQFRSTQRRNTTSSFSSDITDDTMHSRKRPRDADDVDGETEVESATSSFRQQFPKRSRVALAQENGGSVVSDDEDDEPHMPRYEDSGFVDGPDNLSDIDDEDEDINELAATKIVQNQIREHRENIASECGVIEEVFCRNFMCHSKLRIKLGPLINFIIGHNGSGKSAVLTALQMCLGGSAKVTNRGASLKNLIKEGEESATLAVRIKNRGDGAYKTDLYGNSITVERHFSRSGGSAFKIKSSEGQIITTKKMDLDEILDFFAFQLDNPINVLTQDMARQFLSNSSAADKYKFFIRGTQLETLDHDYKMIEESYNGILAKLEGRTEDIEMLKKKWDQAEEKKNRAERARGLERKIIQMENMHSWAQVEAQERALEETEQELRSREDELREREQEAADLEGTYDGSNAAFEAAQRSVEELKAVCQPLQEERDRLKERFADVKGQLLKLKQEQRDMTSEMKIAKARISDRERDIKSEQERIAGAEGPAHAARMEKLEKLKEAAEKAVSKEAEHKPAFVGLKQQFDEAFRAQEEAKEDVNSQKAGLREAEGRLQRLRRTDGRPLEGYKPGMERLVRAVDNETRWRQKPVGPMGIHVRLQQPRWAHLIERMFGGALDGFVVTNTEDQRLLSSVMKRNGFETPIFTGSPEPISTDGHEPDEDVLTVMRALRIDNDLVRNQLVIQYFIDQTCLIEDPDQCMSFMWPAGGQRPRNVKSGMAWTGRECGKGEGIRYDYARSGAEKSSGVNKWVGELRMKADRAQQVNMQQQAVNQARGQLDRAEQELRAKQKACTEAGQGVERHKRQARDLKISREQAQDAVEALNNEIEINRPQDGRLQELERQLAAKRQDLESIESTYQDSINEQDKVDETQREQKAAMDAAQREYDNAANRVDDAESKLDKAEKARENALAQKNTSINAVEGQKRLIESWQERVNNQRKVTEDFVEYAEGLCQRIPVDEEYRDSNAINDRIERLRHDLARAERAAGGSHQDLTEAAAKARETYEQGAHSLKTMSDMSKVRAVARR